MAAGATGDVDATEQLDGPSGTANGHNKGKRQNRKKWRALATRARPRKLLDRLQSTKTTILRRKTLWGSPAEEAQGHSGEEAPAADAFTTDRTPPVAGALTEGALRFAPIPEQCRKGRPGFQANRHAWAAQEKRRLHKLSINVVRVFIRDDGMVESCASDVGYPATTSHRKRSICTKYQGGSPEIIELDSFEPQAPHNEPPPPHNEPLPPQNELPPPPNEPSPPRAHTSLSPPSAEEQELQRLALAFLQKYIRLFDRNRAALAGHTRTPRRSPSRRTIPRAQHLAVAA
ncbi:uncharacterized protein B0H18DRAFT_1115437 [Fomitopsis serialis]|uniref:uncharacterized protein n=1 Tax=Fomitopsis serialis TaxID=139415 RepID=UPI0020086302|nr:uncharacterized protein B0H18DRAFT_1115437 [Neoantrodia serialis]KAH9933435.1 hypothetical protein B0H18DRAFT_1115437 [Neoantrodia serialis]